MCVLSHLCVCIVNWDNMTEFSVSVDYDVKNETVIEMSSALFPAHKFSFWFISIVLLLTLAVVLIYRCMQMSRLSRDISESSYYQSLTPPKSPEVNEHLRKVQWYQNHLMKIKESQFCKKCHLPVAVGNYSEQSIRNCFVSKVRKCEKARPVSQINAEDWSRFDGCINYSIFEQYGSANLLDDYNKCEVEEYNESAVVKSRSLPSSVRQKSRPLSTEEDLLHFYAEVNFSKKRKNRMRNDDAAVIALSKSRSEFSYQETDSLVNNEAVLVYDERTAL